MGIFSDLERKKFLDLAELEATLSPCRSRHVGAVIVSDDGILLGRGHNAEPGVAHLCEEDGCARKGFPSGQRLDLCRAVHAEENALIQALLCTELIRPELKATIFVTHMPCYHCAALLLTAGIHTVVFRHPYGGDPYVSNFLKENGVAVIFERVKK